jgi:hypothetical protein
MIGLASERTVFTVRPKRGLGMFNARALLSSYGIFLRSAARTDCYLKACKRHRAETSRIQTRPHTGRGGGWESSDDRETEMTVPEVVVANHSQIHELSIDELGEAAGEYSLPARR